MALDSPLLSKFLEDVAAGRLQLPDFQRSWKWDDDRIRSLLATVTLDYPMGVVMTLETGGDGARFKERPLAGAAPSSGARAEQLLLDGQQRLTSLYQALASGRPVETEDARGKKLRRWYYIDMAAALSGPGEREDAIISVPEDRVVRQDFGRGVKHDLSSRENECARGYFPLRLVFDHEERDAWMFEYTGDEASRKTWTQFNSQVLQKITTYEVPMIKLTKQTPKEAVCTVFEKVNTGGVALNVFELLTATYAGDRAYFDEHGEDFQLSEYWRKTRQDLVAAYPVLGDFQSTDFLQAVCLVATYQRRQQHVDEGRDQSNAPAVSCKRGDILRLPLADFLAWESRVTEALRWTARFLARQCIFRKEDIPYRTQLVPLAAIRAILGDRVDQPEIEAKLSQWFWCGVLGELYGGTLETRFARDLEQVPAWIDGGSLPGTVEGATFRETRLTTLNSRNSAAYKGVYALVLGQSCVDWYFSKAPIDHTLLEEHQVDVHHIFPVAWCEKHEIDTAKRSSIVNKTPLSRRASRSISTRSPDAYLRVLERESGLPEDWLDDVVATHLIEPRHLRAPDFDAFYRMRTQALLELIEQAMGKEAFRLKQMTPQEQERPEDYRMSPEEPDSATSEM